MMHVYSSEFYDYINSGSTNSARHIAPLMRSVTPIDSVLDVGAGVGAWAAEWMRAGASDVVAVDGPYTDNTSFLVPDEQFVKHDLQTPLDLGRKFALVQSLEVAEHIPHKSADTFIDTLVRHGDIVLFSAAVPGQGGEHHVNERPLEFWRKKFQTRGYAAFDWLRPLIRDEKLVQPWYRYNTIIYANASGQDRLAPEVLEARVSDRRAVPHAGSFAWRLRRALVRAMPTPFVTRVATILAHRKASAYREAGI
ncbi:class I SAM-dependent methyltransferase [Qipengyuania sp. 6D47A]|uniref:Class I SAM-dependent methyltransferase n=2 Tax=Qipengyuania qiaonensis TaxID=2867240 RepID=A0ABS7J351_9SPHN|nr:class I SAM-dependent methyltransferase [Qipengyuania qiaonensis]